MIPGSCCPGKPKKKKKTERKKKTETVMRPKRGTKKSYFILKGKKGENYQG
jgi:hypothetical protein